jgi:hypothetical protein
MIPMHGRVVEGEHDGMRPSSSEWTPRPFPIFAATRWRVRSDHMFSILARWATCHQLIRFQSGVEVFRFDVSRDSSRHGKQKVGNTGAPVLARSEYDETTSSGQKIIWMNRRNDGFDDRIPGLSHQNV